MITIRNLFYIVSVCFIISCNDKNSTPTPNLFAGSMTDFFSDHEQQFQVFTFDASGIISFTGDKGLQFIFPPNCFVDKDGQIVTGNVRIQVKEFVKKGDFIFDRLFTVSGGMPIESAGAFEINVMQNGKELKLANGKSYFVVMLKSEETPMFVYKGSTQNAQFGRVDWVIDTSLNSAVVSPPLDSVFYSNNLQTSGLNYINCDCPYISSGIPLSGTVPFSEYEPFVLIVDKFRNMAVGVNCYGSDFYWDFAPLNTNLTIISIYQNKNNYYLSTQDVFFTGQTIVMPGYHLKTGSEILDFINNL